MDSKPAGITADRQRHTLTIRWKDEHVSQYPFWLLRNACPCVECRGGHDKMSGQPPGDIFDRVPEKSPSTILENLDPVGTYALGFHWSDGHSAGIYSWDYLRALCPCDECRGGWS